MPLPVNYYKEDLDLRIIARLYNPKALIGGALSLLTIGGLQTYINGQLIVDPPFYDGTYFIYKRIVNSSSNYWISTSNITFIGATSPPASCMAFSFDFVKANTNDVVGTGMTYLKSSKPAFVVTSLVTAQTKLAMLPNTFSVTIKGESFYNSFNDTQLWINLPSVYSAMSTITVTILSLYDSKTTIYTVPVAGGCLKIVLNSFSFMIRAGVTVVLSDFNNPMFPGVFPFYYQFFDGLLNPITNQVFANLISQ